MICISLEDIRNKDFDKMTEQLLKVNGFNKICVNAIDYCDAKVFCIALYRAMEMGKNFMFRTAAGFVKVVGGITDRPLLTRKEMVVKETENGGIVVGKPYGQDDGAAGGTAETGIRSTGGI